MRRSLRFGLGLLGLGGALALAGGADRPRRTINPVLYPLSPDSEGVTRLTRSQVREWAAQMGIDEAHMILMIALHSERGRSSSHRAEHQAIARTAVNRSGYPGTWGDDLWEVLVGDAPTTGPQGGTRQYATSRPPKDVEAIRYLYSIAADAIERGPYKGPGKKGITHFHHLSGSRAATVNDRWRRRGYQPVRVSGVAGTFLAPTANKASSLS